MKTHLLIQTNFGIVSLGGVGWLRSKAEANAEIPRFARSRLRNPGFFSEIKLYALISDLGLHAVERCDGLWKNLFCGFLGKSPVIKRGIKAGIKVDEMEQFGARFNGDPRSGLGV
jgi:hypothetical protein